MRSIERPQIAVLLLGLAALISFAARSTPAEAAGASAQPARGTARESARATARESAMTESFDACTAREEWRFGPGISPAWHALFKNFLDGRLSPVRGFAEALAMRGLAPHPEEKAFAEYWLARALLEAELPHIAQQGFMALISKPAVPSGEGVHLAAIECLATLSHKYPTLGLEERVSAALPALVGAATTPERKSTLWKAATLVAIEEIARPKPTRSVILRQLKLLAGSGHYESLVRGLDASTRKEHDSAAENLAAFTRAQSLPKLLAKYRDTAHLLLARAHYASGRHETAAEELKKVEKNSNELAHALSELAWSYLQSDRLGEAIGTAINLQTAGLRRTFSPEAPMVMAIALNELCQFPESIRAINSYRSEYYDSYVWLKDTINGKGRTQERLYELTVGFLKNKGGVPPRVALEWIRSPLFIARQEEINLLYKERAGIEKLGKAGGAEQQAMARKLLETAIDLKKRYERAKIRLKPGQTVAQSILDEITELKRQVVHYHRLRRAAPTWRVILANHERRAPGIQAKLVADVNRDLWLLTRRMYRQLEDIAENAELVEVEIFNGASQDLIWQNAHPDYKKVAGEIQDRAQKAAASKSLSWGRVQTGLEAEGEIWEDELGSFKANLVDNCSSREKYLAIKRVQLLSGNSGE